MKKILIILLLVGIISSCSKKVVLVNDKKELYSAVQSALPGDKILLADGIWSDLKLRVNVSGKKNKPIIITAKNKGKVFIEGKTSINLGGNYIIIKDLFFKNGYARGSAVIRFKTHNDTVANYCSVINCVFDNFSNPDKYKPDHWIEFWGRHNELSNCYIRGKTNQGPTVRVFLKGNRNIWTYHQIKNNYFAERPRRGGPHGETIQVGSSGTSMTPAYVQISNNLFEHCNGEIEVISIKSNFNTVENNVFLLSEGSLVLRHGNYNTINKNIFIGDGSSNNYGGIRVINTGHWITNNYFYKLRGSNFRAPLAIMNGIPKSPLNRYNQVTDVVIAYNSWIYCQSPIQISVGANNDKKDVLPKNEIRSARPKRTIIANNLIYNQSNNNTIIEYDKVDGVRFINNYINRTDSSIYHNNGFISSSFNLIEIDSFLYKPQQCDKSVKLYVGYEFEKISTDLLGNNRNTKNCYGAILDNYEINFNLDKKRFGPDWNYLSKKVIPKSINLSSEDDFNKKLKLANNNDTIILTDTLYHMNSSVVIDKSLTFIASKEKNTVWLCNRADTVFTIKNGKLSLQNIHFKGNKQNILFKADLSGRYKLSIEQCSIDSFKNIIFAEKGSFADTILIVNSSFSDSDNGICLSAETDDKGNYNAEFVIIQNARFVNIADNVINYYRGGYDESTIGGNLIVNETEFVNCGNDLTHQTLIATNGIVNLLIANCFFKNNKVKNIAILWKEKNNYEKNNKIVNSGAFHSIMHLNQTLMY
ncbi:MAG: hypothetical protein L3J74_05300 [Bacteroidales bacterium]|nr:hypothetical protein [Bacteroidales bacterium]